jgi:hypothetical protein
MHFNNTPFPAKPEVPLLSLIVLILAFLTTSCSESEIDGIIDDIEASNWSVFTVPIKLVPFLTVDSIRYDSVSIYKVSASIHYDSTIVLTGFVFHYWENPNEVSTIREVVVDTIDFAKQDPYLHKVRITKLKPHSEYQLRALATYLVGKDTTTIAALPATFKTE